MTIWFAAKFSEFYFISAGNWFLFSWHW